MLRAPWSPRFPTCIFPCEFYTCNLSRPALRRGTVLGLPHSLLLVSRCSLFTEYARVFERFWNGPFIYFRGCSTWRSCGGSLLVACTPSDERLHISLYSFWCTSIMRKSCEWPTRVPGHTLSDASLRWGEICAISWAEAFCHSSLCSLLCGSFAWEVLWTSSITMDSLIRTFRGLSFSFSDFLPQSASGCKKLCMYCDGRTPLPRNRCRLERRSRIQALFVCTMTCSSVIVPRVWFSW